MADVKEDSKIVSALEYGMFFSIIALTGSVWVRQGWFYEHLNFLRLAVLLFPVLLFLINCGRRGFDNVRISVPWLACFGLAGITSWFVNPGLGALLVYCPLICFLLYTNSLSSFDAMLKVVGKFVNIAVFIAAISIFFFFFGSVLHIVSSTGTATYEWEYLRTATSYYNLYFETQNIDFIFYQGVRNCGFFCEAPMFNFILCMALAIQMFLGKKAAWKSVILAIAILTTFSTTGYVALVLIFMLKLITCKVIDKRLRMLRNITVAILIVVAVHLVSIVIGDKTSTNSYDVRSDHLESCLEIFLQTFPFGTGFNNSEAFQEVLSYDQGMSIGLMYYLAQAGLMGCVVFFGACIYCLRYCVKSKSAVGKGMICILVVLLWLFFTTSVVSSSVLWCLFTMLLIVMPSRLNDSNRLGSTDPLSESLAVPLSKERPFRGRYPTAYMRAFLSSE